MLTTSESIFSVHGSLLSFRHIQPTDHQIFLGGSASNVQQQYCNINSEQTIRLKSRELCFTPALSPEGILGQSHDLPGSVSLSVSKAIGLDQVRLQVRLDLDYSLDKVLSISKNMILDIKNGATRIIVHLGKSPSKCILGKTRANEQSFLPSVEQAVWV